MTDPVVVNIAEAKARLSELVDRATRGEGIVIARRGRPLVRLAATDPKRRHWVFGGLDRADVRAIPDDVWFEPDPEDFVAGSGRRGGVVVMKPPYVVAGVLTLHDPLAPAVPLVFDSPHSGDQYPADFDTVAPMRVLRSGEDAFVDELYGLAPYVGATLLCADFPRSYIDANRDALDIDAELLAEPWPVPLRPSNKTKLGLSLIRKLSVPGQPMYSRKLTVAEVQSRIDRYYAPYHAALSARLDELRARFGGVWHIDCHSMKAQGNEMSADPGAERPDFVVSDQDGRSSEPGFIGLVVQVLRDRGHSVSVNDPYKGDELIRRYGRPAENRHSVQIEINRKLYLDQENIVKTEGFPKLKAALDVLVTELAAYAARRAG